MKRSATQTENRRLEKRKILQCVLLKGQIRQYLSFHKAQMLVFIAHVPDIYIFIFILNEIFSSTPSKYETIQIKGKIQLRKNLK